jgi:hypothetical protein
VFSEPLTIAIGRTRRDSELGVHRLSGLCDERN